MTTSNGPLPGLKVLDLSNIVAGGLCASLLADFGAHVVKVERPSTGDPLRQWGPFKDGVSLWWKVLSRNKKSVTLNLAHPKGQAIFKALVPWADILVEGYRPGQMETWGLDYNTLSAINPRLVMVRVSGFGQTGPYRDRPGFGTVAEAMSGLVYSSGFPETPPMLPPIPLADEVAGAFAAMAALMAIYHRDIAGSGKGQVVDVSLYEPLFRLLVPHVTMYQLLGMLRPRFGNHFPDAAPRNLYQTADGQWLALSATSQATFERLAQAMGMPEMVQDHRFKDNPSRVQNREALDGAIGQWVRQRTLDDSLAILQPSGAAVGPVYDTARIMSDPHYQARGNIIAVDDPELGRIAMQGVVPHLSATPGAVEHAGPALGQHNHEVYCGLFGHTPEDVARWQEEGII